ncbi:LamG domain-containing protein, partial [Candidatus Parcubacteria bacterium]|nr:LamG domain-containing protein [Candidatus Parcubacteria bacterium]
AKMDEGSGQTAYDESFNNNDGTLGSTAGSDANDPTWTTGKFGSGLDFDGTDDHIDCGSDNTLDNLINDFTVSLWFNAASLGGIKPALISKYASGIGFDIGFDGTHLEPTKYGIIDYDNSYVFSTNQWYFTTVVFSSTAGIIVYVDGNNEGSSANTTDLNNHDALPLLIGNTANTFNGLIDDVRIYNYARTADEIRADYNAGKAAHLGKNNQRSNGLVGHWNFEEGSGQTISDRSGNGNDGTLGANSSVGKDDPVFAAGHDSNGPEGTGMDFDGVDDYVDCGAVTNLTNTPTTISAWIKLNSNTTNQYIFVQQNSANTGLNGVLLWQPGIDGTGRIGLTANISLATFPYRQSVNNTLLTGTNYHVLATWDGSNTAANIHIYVNGVEVSYADTSNGSGTATASTGKSIIGGRTYDNLRQIDGLIDDVRIYNRALSADEIRMLYNQKKPIFHAKMDEGSGQIAYDESFNDNDGTLGSTSGSDANDPTWTTGKFGSALDFDGVDDYVDAGSDSSLDLSGNMSLFAWAKFDDITSTQQLITQSTAGAGNIGQYGLEVGRTDNEIAISWGSAVIDYSSSNVQTNRWYFIGWTRAGSVGNWKSKIYIDGVLDETRSNIITNPGSQKLLNIGWLNYSIPHYFNGIIDDVRIYNYARTADEILVDYNNGLAARLR